MITLYIRSVFTTEFFLHLLRNRIFDIALLFFGVINGYSFIKKSGWNVLAQRYVFHGSFTGKIWKRSKVTLTGGKSFNVDIGASFEGLYLELIGALGWFYPKLLIPWGEIKEQRGSLHNGKVSFTAGSENPISFSLPRDLVRKIEEVRTGATNW